MSKLQNKRTNRKSSSRSGAKTNSRSKASSNDKEDFDDTNPSRKPKGKGSNDPSWYGADAAILRDAASIPYSWPIGTDIPLGNDVIPELIDREYQIPGICSINLAPSVGFSDDPNSAVNVASTAMYAFVRHANSGHANYEAPDLMLYVLSMSQIYSYINFLQRAYGVATLYSQRNRYLPAALLNSMGIDHEDINANLANFRYGLNVLINKAASLAVPANMTIFARHAFLYQNVYTEGPSVKDQLYLYNPYGFWRFQIEEAGMLKFVKFSVASLDDSRQDKEFFKVKDLLAFGDYLLNPILGDEDMNIMSGDILKAYGANILQLQTVPEYYPLVPVYNVGVLEQMQNATVLSEQVRELFIDSLDITQELGINKSYLKSLKDIVTSLVPLTNKPTTVSAFKGISSTIERLLCSSNRLLTTLSPEATPELTMENSRLTLGFKTIKKSSTSVTLRPFCGTEVAVECKLYNSTHYFNRGSAVSLGSTNVLLHVEQGTNVANALYGDEERAIVMATAFNYAPLGQIYSVYAGSTTAPQISFRGIRGNLGNYAVLNVDDIKRLHDAALMNQLAVPSIAKLR